MARQREAMSIARRLAATIDGIQGVDWGYVHVERRATRRAGIRFHVARKNNPAGIAAGQMLPKEILGVRCDVIEARYALHASEPLRPGVSVGNVKYHETGTLGALVRDRATQEIGVLSNWHVLAADVRAVVDDEISYPGPSLAGNQEAAVVAKLVRWTSLDHSYDAAFASLVDAFKHQVDQTTLGLNVRIRRTVEPMLGMRVTKFGVGTGLTNAIVDAIDGSYPVDYTKHGDQLRWMDGIHLAPDPDDPQDEISMGGDSGAVWVRRDAPDEAVALGFGGEDHLGPTAEYALAHPMQYVMQKLDLEWLPE